MTTPHTTWTSRALTWLAWGWLSLLAAVIGLLLVAAIGWGAWAVGKWLYGQGAAFMVVVAFAVLTIWSGRRVEVTDPPWREVPTDDTQALSENNNGN